MGGSVGSVDFERRDELDHDRIGDLGYKDAYACVYWLDRMREEWESAVRREARVALVRSCESWRGRMGEILEEREVKTRWDDIMNTL